MQELVTILKEKKYTIASIESITAGLFASLIAEQPGASAILKGALVTYQTICKEEILHVSKELIDKYGVISEEVVKEMCIKGKEMFNSDIVVSFSGNAGPERMDNKEVGLVYMSIIFKEEIHVFHKVFKGERNEIRMQACHFMSENVLKLIRH